VLYGDPRFGGERSFVAISASPGSRVSGYSTLNQIPSRFLHAFFVGHTYLDVFGINLTEWYIFAGNNIF